MQHINRIQIFIGAVALFLGSFVYLIDRPPEQTYFVKASHITISLYNTIPNLFGPLGNSLPTYVHVFSFILITAGLMTCRKRGYLIICLGWFLVDVAFELGQKFSGWSAGIIPDWFVGIPFLENTKRYFLNGTFDFQDLAAICLGAITAYLLLLITSKHSRGKYHEKFKKQA